MSMSFQLKGNSLPKVKTMLAKGEQAARQQNRLLQTMRALAKSQVGQRLSEEKQNSEGHPWSALTSPNTRNAKSKNQAGDC